MSNSNSNFVMSFLTNQPTHCKTRGIKLCSWIFLRMHNGWSTWNEALRGSSLWFANHLRIIQDTFRHANGYLSIRYVTRSQSDTKHDSWLYFCLGRRRMTFFCHLWHTVVQKSLVSRGTTDICTVLFIQPENGRRLRTAEVSSERDLTAALRGQLKQPRDRLAASPHPSIEYSFTRA